MNKPKYCVDCFHYCHFPVWDGPVDVCLKFTKPGADAVGRKNNDGFALCEVINKNHDCPDHYVSMWKRICKFLKA